MKNSWKSILFTFVALIVLASTAHAHHAEWMKGKPMLQGLSMPIHGLDHFLVAVAVGMIAVQLGRPAIWLVPFTFSGIILLGGVINVLGIPSSLVETGIFASVIVLGGYLASNARLPLAAVVAVIALFAACHAQELVGSNTVNAAPAFYLWFASGCMIAALAVQGLGMAIGFAIKRYASDIVFRYAGVAVLAIAALIYFFPAANDILIRGLE
jgi:urease accessory protein